MFQALDVMNDHQLDHALKLDFKVSKEAEDIFSDFNQ